MRSARRSSIGPVLDLVLERVALEVLHHHVDDAVLGLAEVGDVDDVLVVDLVGGARLAEEALAQALVLRQRRVEELERDVAADELVARAVHRAHAAHAEQLLDHVAAGDGGADERVVGADQRLAVDRADADVAPKAGVTLRALL